MQITIPVSVECTDAFQEQKVKEILSRYSFKGAGLIKLDEKLSKKDFIVTSATKDFITKK